MLPSQKKGSIFSYVMRHLMIFAETGTGAEDR